MWWREEGREEGRHACLGCIAREMALVGGGGVMRGLEASVHLFWDKVAGISLG